MTERDIMQRFIKKISNLHLMEYLANYGIGHS